MGVYIVEEESTVTGRHFTVYLRLPPPPELITININPGRKEQ
jgi:hypothetical protein